MNETPLQSTRPRRQWVPVAGLALLALLAAGLVSVTERLTRDRIASNQSLQTLKQLHTVLPADYYDNDLHLDRILLLDPPMLGSRTPLPAWRARRGGRPVAAVLTVVAPNGYSGPITMLVAVRTDGRILDVRVTEHRETPGIGDLIEAGKSDWILGFRDRAIGRPPELRWRLKIDGGEFDHITGASMTSRTIVSALRRALVYFSAHQEQIFATPAGTGYPAGGEAPE